MCLLAPTQRLRSRPIRRRNPGDRPPAAPVAPRSHRHPERRRPCSAHPARHVPCAQRRRSRLPPRQRRPPRGPDRGPARRHATASDRRSRGHRQHSALRHHRGRRPHAARGQPPGQRSVPAPAAASRTSASPCSPRACFEVVRLRRGRAAGRSAGSATQPAPRARSWAPGGLTPRGSARRIRSPSGRRAARSTCSASSSRGDLDQNPYVAGRHADSPAAPRGHGDADRAASSRPGEYELRPNGSLSELLELTGGLANGGAGSDSPAHPLRRPTAARRRSRSTCARRSRVPPT